VLTEIPAKASAESLSVPADSGRETRRPPGDGVRLAAANVSPWWLGPATSAVHTLARTGRPFSTEDLRELGVPEPDKSCRWGALMAACYRAALIESTGAVIGRRGRPVRLWIGVKPE